MRFILNGEEYNLPTDLTEITLKQRIDYQRLHGDLLDEMFKSISDMAEGPEKEIELTGFKTELMLRTVSFFTGLDIEVLRESSFLKDIIRIYNSSVKVLFTQEDSLELETEFEWLGKIWHLYKPELENGDKMKCGQLADAKQRLKDMIKLGANQWESLKPLCVIYLLQEGEEYEESFLFEGSERLQLMDNLPMNIALQVGFFLLSTQNIWINTFLFSGQAQ